jgi:hypothetical protein
MAESHYTADSADLPLLLTNSCTGAPVVAGTASNMACAQKDLFLDGAESCFGNSGALTHRMSEHDAKSPMPRIGSDI